MRIRVTFKGSRESLQRLPEYLSSCRGIHLDSIKEGRNIVAEGSLQDGELGLAVFLTDVQSTGLLENLVVRWTRIDQLPE